MPRVIVGEHPPLSSYQPGDRAIVTCEGHRHEGEEVEVLEYDGWDLMVRYIESGIGDYFSVDISLSPVRRTPKRPISAIFYPFQT